MEKSSHISPEEEKEYLLKMGKRLKQLRIEKGYSNYENFAFESGLSRTQYGRYEKGTNIQFTTLLRITKAHNITLAEFFSEGFD